MPAKPNYTKWFRRTFVHRKQIGYPQAPLIKIASSWEYWTLCGHEANQPKKKESTLRHLQTNTVCVKSNAHLIHNFSVGSQRYIGQKIIWFITCKGVVQMLHWFGLRYVWKWKLQFTIIANGKIAFRHASTLFEISLNGGEFSSILHTKQ